MRCASMLSGISRGSRPMVRHQPQLRLDCSPPMRPFSQRAAEMPFSARASTVLTPMMPPPITTTSTRAGRLGSDSTGSTGGDMVSLFLQRPDGGWCRAGDPDGIQENWSSKFRTVASPHRFPGGVAGWKTGPGGWWLAGYTGISASPPPRPR